MPRHVHKPSKDKSTKSILQSIHDAQQATKDIKAELLEHNSKIHLHATPADAQNNNSGLGNEQTPAQSGKGQASQKSSSGSREAVTSQKPAWPADAKASKSQESNVSQDKNVKPQAERFGVQDNSARQDKNERNDGQPQQSEKKSDSFRPDESAGSNNKASSGNQAPDEAFSPYTNAMNMLQQSTLQWFEMQSQFANLWMSGFSKLTTRNDK